LDTIFSESVDQKSTIGVARTIRAGVHNVGARILEQYLQCKLETGYCGVILEKSNGKKLKFQGYRMKQYTSCLGQITLKRAYYTGIQGGYFPLEDAHPWLAGSILPDVQELALLMASCEVYRHSSKVLQEVGGFQISATAIERLVKEKAQGIENLATVPQINTALSEENQQLYVISADGVMVRLYEEWREVKLGAMYGVPPDSNGTAETKSYVGRIEPCESFGQRLRQEANRRGVDDAAEVVFISDGAKWLQDQAITHFPKATKILDWYHAVEHMWNYIDLLLGDRSTDFAKHYADEWTGWLYEGKEDKFLETIRVMVTKARGERRRKMQKEIQYFENNIERMRYKIFRDAGYPIGSGIIEGGCKNVVQFRFKRAGMRWKERGLHDVLGLRCLFVSDRWSVVRTALDDVI
jgi:hypothetical protein